MSQYIIIFFSAFLLSLSFITIFKKLFYKYKILDNPVKYKLKRNPIPYSMWVVFFISFFILSYFFLAIFKKKIISKNAVNDIIGIVTYPNSKIYNLVQEIAVIELSQEPIWGAP